MGRKKKKSKEIDQCPSCHIFRYGAHYNRSRAWQQNGTTIRGKISNVKGRVRVKARYDLIKRRYVPVHSSIRIYNKRIINKGWRTYFECTDPWHERYGKFGEAELTSDDYKPELREHNPEKTKLKKLTKRARQSKDRR